MELIKIGKPCKYWLPSRKIKWTWSLFLCISLNCVRCVSPDKYVDITIPIGTQTDTVIQGLSHETKLVIEQ